jgi:cutinase
MRQLFGLPNSRAMNFLGEPSVVIGPLYQAKTLKCALPEDFVCSDGMDFAAHNPTTYTGPLTDQGAAFAASHLSRTA